ncbi:efflux RND transporter permease subunit [Paracoccus jiaweipingae]|uniref:efflux RND transporter permease subunit n=1 Tax=unclassified Paracoccus (in: a-proteobacteria) TaxID=2688777 RepID=UPI00378FB131
MADTPIPRPDAAPGALTRPVPNPASPPTADATPGDQDRGLLALFVRHATLANLVLAVMVVAGLYAAPRLRAQFFPDSVIEAINVSVRWDGAGAEDVDSAIVAVLEPALMAVEGVARTESRATEGSARIEMEFEPGWDMSRALSETETAIAAASDLPDAAERPDISRAAWRDGVADIVVTGPVGLDQLARLSDDLLHRLYARGITRATIQGIAAPEVEVSLRSESLIRHDLTLSQIAAAIAPAVSGQPAGDVATGAARIRTGSQARDPAAVAALVLRAGADGSKLTVGDVADITAHGPGHARAYFHDNDPAVLIRVQRSAAGDAIAIQNRVEALLHDIRPTLPQGVHLDLIRTRADMIADRLGLLLDNALLGLGLVVVLLFLFLNARTALWVAAGIPASMLAALAFMYLSGVTLNMMSMFALILCLGIIVDDAIVVGEHADFRARHLAEPPRQAATRAVRRMAAPVVSSTLTTVIAFAGLVAIGGTMGRMIQDVPKTVIAVLMASLVECFLVLPNHMAHALGRLGQPRWYDRPSMAVNRGLGWLVARVVRPLAGWTIRLRYAVLAIMLAGLTWAGAAIVSGTVPWRFFDAPESGTITGNFLMAPGATRDDTMAVMAALQHSVAQVAARYAQRDGRDPLTYVLAETGGHAGRPLPGAETRDADLLGSVTVELIDPDLRSWSSFQFIADLQQAAPQHPLLETISFRGFRAGPAGDAISVMLTGADAAGLKHAAEDLKARLARFPEVSALEDSMAYDKPELELVLSPQGRALGFTTAGLAADLRAQLAGIEAATWPEGTRSASIRVTLDPRDRAGDFLDRMRVRSERGEWVALGDVVQLRERSGFSTIRRQNGQRQITVTGDIFGDDPARAALIQRQIGQTILPELAAAHGVDTVQTGLKEQERDFRGQAMAGFALALTGIYLVLCWIFASWTRPLVVMSVIPFGLIGAVWGHHLWGIALSMFSVVGLIGMSGIIINDSIVLISTIDDHARDRALRPAIIAAVGDRFRAVLLTTATTVLGLAPLLYERSSQALFLKSTVVSLCYGLGFGLVIVLLVVPATLMIGADLGRARAALRRGWSARATRAPLRWAAAGIGLAGLVLAAPFIAAPLGGVPGWWPLTGAITTRAGAAMAAYAVLAGLTGAGLLVWAARARRPGQSRRPG